MGQMITPHVLARLVEILKIIVSISDVLLFGVLVYFVKPLRWGNERERSSIIGFWWMMVTVCLSIGCIWL